MKNKETFIRMINFVHIIPYAFQNLDVGDFDFEIDFYDSEGNADIEEYFCSFPEYSVTFSLFTFGLQSDVLVCLHNSCRYRLIVSRYIFKYCMLHEIRICDFGSVHSAVHYAVGVVVSS